MNKEQEEMWERLKHVPGLTQYDITMVARSFGKSALAMQAFGRAIRNANDLVQQEQKDQAY